MARSPIRIMTRDFELVGEVDGYSSLSIQRKWHGVGMLTMKINANMNNAEQLTKDRIIFPQNRLDQGYIIRDRSIELTGDGKESEDWTITAVSLKSLTRQRTTIPLDGSEHDTFRGPAEGAFFQFANNNMVNPLNARTDRRFNDLILGTNLNRGQTSFFQTRLDRLDELFEEMSIFSGLGWNVDIDTSLNKFVFNVLEGRNLTTSQNLLPPVIFAPDFGTISEMTYSESTIDHKNVAVVAGPGEGDARILVEVGEASGWDRYELFVDARDVPSQTEPEGEGEPTPRPIEDIESDLNERGQQKLAEYEQIFFAGAKILTQGNLRYRVDYDLGDVVTIRNLQWGITLEARITDVNEVYESDGFKIELVFDNDVPDFISKVKRRIDNLSVEAKR